MGNVSIEYDYSKNVLRLSSGNVKYDLSLRRFKVQITGDSGVGKSLLYSTIEKFKKNDKSNGTSFASNIYLVEDFDGWSGISKRVKHCLFIVDNSEYIINENKQFLDEIKHDLYNQYIIIARRAYNLGISGNNYATLKLINGVFRLEYALSIRGW